MWKLSHFLVSSSTFRIQANAIRCLAQKVQGNSAQRPKSNYNQKQAHQSASLDSRSSVPLIKPLAVTSMGRGAKKPSELPWKPHYKDKRRGGGNYGDPGIKNSLKTDMTVDPFHTDPDAFDDYNEVDVFKADQIYDDYQKDRIAMKELIKHKIVERKYFRTHPEGKLSWEEKEHIHYLHNTDPEMWNHQMLAENFGIDLATAKKITKSKWLSYKKKDVPQDEKLPMGPKNPLPKSREKDVPLHPKISKKYITLSEFQRESGSPVREHHLTESAHCDANQVNQDLTTEMFLQDIPKWADRNRNLTDKENEDWGKTDHTIKEPGVKVADDLYQRGDSFYSSKGEFLYRVPVLSRK